MTSRPNLVPPTEGSFLSSGSFTPSGLTPNLRSQAEQALLSNSTAQTDSAAPDPCLLPLMGSGGGNEAASDNGPTEAIQAYKGYRRPGVVRASSANYENALKRAQEASVSSDLSVDSEIPDSTTTNNNNNSVSGGETIASPASMSTPFPPPGQGVVPLNYNSPVGLTLSDPQHKKSRSRGLSLSGLAQQQGWTEQDYKRIYSADLMQVDPKNSAGYSSGQTA